MTDVEKSEPEKKPKGRRGFASMSPDRQREIARLGGKSVPNESRSFSKNKALAIAAGRKGGAANGVKKKRRSSGG